LIRHCKVILFVLLFSSTASSTDFGLINLDPLQKDVGNQKIYQNTYAKISNPFNSTLYNISVTESPSKSRVLFIDDFQSGQSFEIFFSKAGMYEICYSNVKQIKSLRTCLKVDVVKAKSV